MNHENNNLTITEEVFNSITHGIGALLGLAGLLFGLFMAKTFSTFTISFIIYAVCLIALMLASTLYHALAFTKAKKVFKILDHSGIYLLIVGTYTPIIIYLYHGWVQNALLVAVWVLAITGIALKASLPNKMAKYSMALYIALGWLALLLIPKLITLPNIILILIITGGVLYTLGASLLAFKKPFVHVAWHIFVVMAASAHFFAITILL